MDLSGKVALVTGGAVRVGRAISLALAQAGADVVIDYGSSEEAALATAREIEGLGRRALPYKASIADSEQVASLIDTAVNGLGRLDILVNSASSFQRTPWPELTDDEWDQVLGVVLRGAMLCSRAAAPHLAAFGSGAIVNIVDLSAFVPFPGFVAHSAAKGGLLALTRALAVEMAPDVRVNAIAPGLILPPPSYSAERVAAMVDRTLLGRWGRPEDVGQAVVYLAQADFVTGVVLPVDGGELLK